MVCMRSGGPRSIGTGNRAEMFPVRAANRAILPILWPTPLKKRTLTALYNRRGKPDGAWLDALHQALDKTGWPATLYGCACSSFRL
jgi:hypothetical protein